MRRLLILSSLMFVLASCSSFHLTPQANEQSAQFAPVAMRIHPIFTRITDWTGDNYPDGIDALLEFQDQLGDSCKASGRVIFELYSFQKFDAERKGPRICNPWVGTLESVDDQRLRWNRTSRTYGFQLAWSAISATDTYLLTAEFQQANGGRFYDQIVLEPPQGAYAAKGTTVPTTFTSEEPSTGPSSAPTAQPTSQP
jgi:hypothetical protein